MAERVPGRRGQSRVGHRSASVPDVTKALRTWRGCVAGREEERWRSDDAFDHAQCDQRTPGAAGSGTAVGRGGTGGGNTTIDCSMTIDMIRHASMSSQVVPRRPTLVGELCCSPVLQAPLGTADAAMMAGALKVLAERDPASPAEPDPVSRGRPGYRPASWPTGWV